MIDPHSHIKTTLPDQIFWKLGKRNEPILQVRPPSQLLNGFWAPWRWTLFYLLLSSPKEGLMKNRLSLISGVGLVSADQCWFMFWSTGKQLFSNSLYLDRMELTRWKEWGLWGKNYKREKLARTQEKQIVFNISTPVLIQKHKMDFPFILILQVIKMMGNKAFWRARLDLKETGQIIAFS